MWQDEINDTGFGSADDLDDTAACGASLRELREATRFDQWRVRYQPIVELATGCCAGAEALLRWQHPVRGLLQPSDFIELAESSGHILSMTRSVIREVAADLHRLARGGHDLYLGINLVAQHFRDQRIVLDLIEAIYAQPVSASRLMLEITERGRIDAAEALPVMSRLREHGFMLAIDDFGAYDASMVYLARFPVSHMKIDKTMVDHIDRDACARRALQGVAAMARGLGVSVVAEGVETRAQADCLAACGVQYAQGYVFCQPLPVGELEAFIAAGSFGRC